jgi:hypothetical protein
MMAQFDAKRNKNKKQELNYCFRLSFKCITVTKALVHLVIEGTQGDATLRSL